MEQRKQILPGVFLRAIRTDKFKTGSFSINLLRPHCREEASMNALLPSVLLRGTQSCPDIAAISNRLDDLYGATLGASVRKKGNVQMVGIYCDFIEDCYTPNNEAVFASSFAFAAEVLLCPRLENGAFSELSVRGEKRNLINAIEGQKNDKRSYLVQKLTEQMFRNEKSGIPRCGYIEDVEKITPQSLYAHYCTILAESQIEILYMGSQSPEKAAELIRNALKGLPRREPFTSVCAGGAKCGTEPEQTHTLHMEVTQGKLAIGLRTGCTVEQPDYPALMLLNVVLGVGMTSKLFVNVREKRSLCYYAGSSLDKYRGIMIISSGVEFDKLEMTKEAILQELEACRRGEISDEEIENARRMILSVLKELLDAPSRLDDYYLGMSICPKTQTVQELMESISKLTVPQLVAAAQKIETDTIYYLRGMEE